LHYSEEGIRKTHNEQYKKVNINFQYILEHIFQHLYPYLYP